MTEKLENRAWSFEDRFRQFGIPQDLEETIRLRQEALRLSPVGSSDRPGVIESLVCSLISRADTYGDFTDRTPSVDLARELLGLSPVGHNNRSGALNALGWSLHQRFKSKGDDIDLEEAIVLLREGSTIKDGSQPYLMCGLACALRTKFERHSHARDVLEAVDVMRESAKRQDRTNPSWEAIMFLGTILAFSFQISGDTKVIDEAITLHRQSLQQFPGRHAYRYTHLLSLARSLRFRGGVTGLAEAKKLLEEALELIVGDSPGNLRRQAKVRMRLEELEAKVAAEVKNGCTAVYGSDTDEA